jgi:hypothetical protein
MLKLVLVAVVLALTLFVGSLLGIWYQAYIAREEAIEFLATTCVQRMQDDYVTTSVRSECRLAAEIVTR